MKTVFFCFFSQKTLINQQALIIFCIGCEHPNVDTSKSNEDYNNNSKIFWEKIFEQDQDTVDYFINWIKDNPNIEEIYFSHQENRVGFFYDKETLFDVDERITNFIEKNDIYLGVERDKIIFTHDFWESDIYGGYALYYIEHDENADEKGFKLRLIIRMCGIKNWFKAA